MMMKIVVVILAIAASVRGISYGLFDVTRKLCAEQNLLSCNFNPLSLDEPLGDE